MSAKTWVPLGMAAGLGLVAMVVAKKAMTGGDGNSKVGIVSVAVANRDVPTGKELSAEDLTVARIPAELVPAQSIHDVKQLVGRTSIFPLSKGQTVLETLLAPSGAGAGAQALIPLGMRAMTMEINEFSGVAGMLAPGCRVDVITVLRDPKTDQLISRTILQNIKVQAVGRQLSATVPEGAPPPPPSNNVTLLLTQKQAQTLQLASQSARPWLVLRSTRDADQEEVEGTTLAEIRGDRSGAPTLPAMMTQDDPFAGPSTRPFDTAGQDRVLKVIRGTAETEVHFNADVRRPTTRPATPAQKAQPPVSGRVLTGTQKEMEAK